MMSSIDPEFQDVMSRRHRERLQFRNDVDHALAAARALREAEAALRERLHALNTKLSEADIPLITDLCPLPKLSRVIGQLEGFFDD